MYIYLFRVQNVKFVHFWKLTTEKIISQKLHQNEVNKIWLIFELFCQRSIFLKYPSALSLTQQRATCSHEVNIEEDNFCLYTLLFTTNALHLVKHVSKIYMFLIQNWNFLCNRSILTYNCTFLCSMVSPNIRIPDYHILRQNKTFYSLKSVC